MHALMQGVKLYIASFIVSCNIIGSTHTCMYEVYSLLFEYFAEPVEP